MQNIVINPAELGLYTPDHSADVYKMLLELLGLNAIQDQEDQEPGRESDQESEAWLPSFLIGLPCCRNEESETRETDTGGSPGTLLLRMLMKWRPVRAVLELRSDHRGRG